MKNKISTISNEKLNSSPISPKNRHQTKMFSTKSKSMMKKNDIR